MLFVPQGTKVNCAKAAFSSLYKRDEATTLSISSHRTEQQLQPSITMKLFLLAAMLALAAADQQYQQAYPAPAAYQPAPAYQPAYQKPLYDEPARPHSFDYAVKDPHSYADFAHAENSDGKTVNGEYRVNLPDGRTQIVTYKADDYGHVADVQYIGEAKYPEEKPYKAAYAPAPAYPKY